MSIAFHQHEHFESLTLDPDGLYLILGYGTGDTFNALIHLAKAPPLRPYELVIKAPQENLVRFLLGVFPMPPRAVHSIPYWKHDFSPLLAARFPSLPFLRGVEPNMQQGGLVDFWQHPFNYQKIIPLTGADIGVIRAYLRAVPPVNPLPEGAVILFTTAGANFTDYIPDWAGIVERLKARGVEHIYFNHSGVADYGNEIVPGGIPLHLKHDELIRSVYGGTRLKLLSVRSGMIDILRFSRQRALVLYQPQPEGIFETCRFGLLKHNLDLLEVMCLNHSREQQDAQIHHYIDKFLTSPIDGGLDEAFV